MMIKKGDRFESLTFTGEVTSSLSNGRKRLRLKVRCNCGENITIAKGNWGKQKQCKKCSLKKKAEVIAFPKGKKFGKFTITGKTKILSSDTSGSANVVMVPNTGTPSAVTGIKIHGVPIQSGGTGTHFSVNRNTANTSIPFDIVGTGNIGVTISNASVSGSSVTLNSPSTSTSGSFSGTCSIGTAAQNGSSILFWLINLVDTKFLPAKFGRT